MELLNLPVELIYSNILPFLKWNALLKLRQANQDLRKLVDSFIFKEFGSIPRRIEIEINEQVKTWHDIDFLQMGLLASNFYLNNPSGPDFFKSEAVTSFLKKHGSQITQLRIHKMSSYPSGRELQFYVALKNLACLKIEFVLGPNDSLSQTVCLRNFFGSFTNRLDASSNQPQLGPPKSFRNLKILKINYGNHSQQVRRYKLISAMDMLTFNISFLDKCEKLEELALAVNSSISCYPSTLIIYFNEIITYLHRRARKFPHKPNLKVFDLKNHSHMSKDTTRRISPSFLNLSIAFARYNVKVRNVPANLFKAFNPLHHEDNILSNTIESMKGLHPAVLRVELPHLTSLNIVTLVQTSFHGGQHPYQTAWPALQKLDLLVNTKNLWACTRQGQKIPSISVYVLLDLLFGTKQSRTALKSLRLQFSSRTMDSMSYNDQSAIPCPSIKNIVSSCPNITKLEIVNWPSGNNRIFSQLWKGLKMLVEIRLTKCKLLSDQAFIGKSENQPAFLQLKNLKKLCLIDLDKMPMISDIAFTTVFRHAPLLEFVIYSDKPLKNITTDGVLSLLSGKFARTIEKFPFGCWSIANVNAEQWKDLYNKFR